MNTSNKRISILEPIIQSLIIFSCVYAGYTFTLTYDIIPKSIIRLPEVHVSTNDLWQLSIIFTTVFLLFLIPKQIISGGGVFSKPKRFASEYLIYLCAYTTASMYVFLATTINYDPQLIAAIGLFSTIVYFLFFIIWYAKKETEKSKFGSLYLVPFEVIKSLISVKGVLVLIYFIFPLLLGKAFTSDRDVANLITQVRIWFNPIGNTAWGLNTLYPGIEFSQPILVKQAPGDSENLYVLERSGRIIKLQYPNSEKKELILDASNLLGEVEVENGALGFDFHPEFNQKNSTNSRFVYLYYTEKRGEEQVNKISRFDLSSNDINSRLETETPLFSLDRHADGFHNGGSVEFGPNGYLYIGLGEGVHPKGATSYSEVLRSGVIRVDVDLTNTDASFLPEEPFDHGSRQGYLIPKDNPFVGNPDVMDEYWALGLRNPFRFTFDPKTAEIWLGDVGSAVWEEVNIIEKGKHYQFPFIEGTHPTGKEKPENLPAPEQGPIYAYEHTAYDRAVIGGVVYRGDKFSELYGKYIFADNYSAKIFLLDYSDKENIDVKLIAQGSQYAQRGVSSVIQLENGDVLITLLGAASTPTGEILSLITSDDVTDSESSDVNDEVKHSQSEHIEYDKDITRQLYAVNCSRCHGSEGRGDGPDSDVLGVELPDFTTHEFQSSRTDSDIYSVIEKGGAPLQMSPMMPPWGGFLKDAEIDHLTIYTRELGKIEEIDQH